MRRSVTPSTTRIPVPETSSIGSLCGGWNSPRPATRWPIGGVINVMSFGSAALFSIVPLRRNEHDRAADRVHVGNHATSLRHRRRVHRSGPERQSGGRRAGRRGSGDGSDAGARCGVQLHRDDVRPAAAGPRAHGSGTDLHARAGDPLRRAPPTSGPRSCSRARWPRRADDCPSASSSRRWRASWPSICCTRMA